MTFKEAYQQYCDESDPDHHNSMAELFEWFFNAGRENPSINVDVTDIVKRTAEECAVIAENKITSVSVYSKAIEAYAATNLKIAIAADIRRRFK